MRPVERKTRHKKVAAALDELNIATFQDSTVTRNHAWPRYASRKGMRIGMRRDVWKVNERDIGKDGFNGYGWKGRERSGYREWLMEWVWEIW